MILLYQYNKMSKTDKLDRMKNTVLETTGLTYTPGETIELNFTPDVTDTGVSVPLVIGGISPTSAGICAIFTNYTNVGGPILGYPYAQIIDNPSTSSDKFTAYSQSLSTGTRSYYNIGISGGVSPFTWKVRDMSNTVIDEIGVGPVSSGPSPASGISYDGKGSYFTLPVGVYHAKLYMTSIGVRETIGILFNHTKNEILLAPYLNTYSNPFNFFVQSITHLRGRFEIKDENDKILVLHAAHTDFTYSYFYTNLSAGITNNPFNNIPLNLQLWKIR